MSFRYTKTTGTHPVWKKSNNVYNIDIHLGRTTVNSPESAHWTIVSLKIAVKISTDKGVQLGKADHGSFGGFSSLILYL